jgi:hypothetical protein
MVTKSVTLLRMCDVQSAICFPIGSRSSYKKELQERRGQREDEDEARDDITNIDCPKRISVQEEQNLQRRKRREKRGGM